MSIKVEQCLLNNTFIIGKLLLSFAFCSFIIPENKLCAFKVGNKIGALY